MITAWRIVTARRAADAFSGEGARRYGGRWNHPGTAVVYLADSLALAALEQFVHLGKARTTLKLTSFRVRIPAALIERLKPRNIPANWRAQPPPNGTMDIGTAWAARASSAALKVPSVLIPVEHNFIIDPGHADFAQINIGAPEPFSFDPRMWK